MSAVPTVYGTLAQVPVDADIGALRVPIVGASPLPGSVREDFAAHTGRRLLEGYGLTEATCATTWTRPGEERPGSVGRVLPWQQIKAVTTGADGSWTDCGPGETGVLVIGGSAVFAGYVTDPALGGPRVSRDGIVRDGWLDTGDLGQVDDGGFVYLTGRAKDLIIRGGHNIDPRVIEDALLAHPAVRAAAAVGRPDRHSGEVPVAYVVPAGPGPFDETELLAWAGTAIGEAAARPKRIYPIDAIPLTSVGKQFKPALLADAAVRVVDRCAGRGGPGRRPGHRRARRRAAGPHRDRRRPGPRTRRGRRIRPDRPLRACDGRPDRREMTRRRDHDHERPVPRELPAGHRRRRRPGRLTAALLLADYGIPVTLLERYPQPHPLPRAVHLDDEVARVLDRIGVGEGFLARSRPGSGLRLLDARHRVMAEFRRDQQPSQHGFPRPTCSTSPTWNSCCSPGSSQHPLIDLRRGAEVTGLDGALDALTADPVRVHARIAGEPQTFTGRVVLGCDGANSTIRQLAGITMEDLGFTERWLVVDIKAEHRPGYLGRGGADLRPGQARHLHAASPATGTAGSSSWATARTKPT